MHGLYTIWNLNAFSAIIILGSNKELKRDTSKKNRKDENAHILKVIRQMRYDRRRQHACITWLEVVNELYAIHENFGQTAVYNIFKLNKYLNTNAIAIASQKSAKQFWRAHS